MAERRRWNCLWYYHHQCCCYATAESTTDPAAMSLDDQRPVNQLSAATRYSAIQCKRYASLTHEVQAICTEWWDAGVLMCLGHGADLYMAQLMPLPLNISCSSKSRLILPFWCRLTRVVPDKIQEGHKMVVCVTHEHTHTTILLLFKTWE